MKYKYIVTVEIISPNTLSPTGMEAVRDAARAGVSETFTTWGGEGNPVSTKITREQAYDREHGDDKPCAKCGHAYYRHFDSYEGMAPVGCKYCLCGEYQEGPNA